jgi:DNA-binding winged helix-turn-helix (wHTH) protein
MIRIGEWRLEPHRNTLVDGAREVRIEPRAMQLLLYLAEHSGTIVTKEAIIRDVWDGVFVTDEALTYSIFEARKALGDDARRPRYIQTVPRKGYRLIAPVSEDDGVNLGVSRGIPPRWLPDRRVLGLVLLAVGFAAALTWIALRRGAEPSRAVLSSLTPPPAAQGALDFGELALSPDGRQAAWVARSRNGERILWTQSLRSGDAKALRGTEGAEFPFWSPEGDSIGFFAQGKLKRIEIANGAPRELCAAAFPWGGAWGRNGWILFAVEGKGIERVRASGGDAENVVLPTGPTVQYRWPSWLPDERHFLDLVIDDGSPDEARIVLHELGGGVEKALLSSGSRAEYAAPGYILHLRGRHLVARRFDLERLELAGESVVLAELVRETQGHTAFSLSQTGLLAYQPAAPVGAEPPAFSLLDWNRVLEAVSSESGHN